ncbi:hypothetical protein E2493_20110 [Sphingomonas parva]|uniref:Uncharacterized protein n=1 Tax=Sphingomonas parva TaxID=2555898 RepID=A0A4Y8ZKD0_9SPHN|nr:YdbH domain-containing protein [Sphingomonas parva]TFI56453.1 hypothetical protein E2493_20110 [Sphingomonas parva]
MDEQDPEAPERQPGDAPEGGTVLRRRRRLVLPVILFVLVAALALAWALRMQIASTFLGRELARRGVEGSYTVKSIGFGRQRLEDVVIGKAGDPDLVAKSVEIELSWTGLRRPKIALITARGVRLRGRVVDGRISLGQIDKLLPPPSGAPFRFPDQAVDVADASLRLETPAGRIGIGLEGRGNLADGFRGRMAASARALQLGTCRIAAPFATGAVAIAKGRPGFAGPVRAAALGCGEFLVAEPRLGLDVQLAEALNAWRGKASLAAAGLRLDSNRLGALAGSIGFEGDAGRTAGAVNLAAASARVGEVAAGRTRIDGRYALSLKTGSLSLQADAGARGVSAVPLLAGAIDALGSAGGTPLERVGEALAAALRRAGSAFDAAGSIRLVRDSHGAGLRFERLIALSRSGARLTLEGGEGVTYAWPSGLSRIDGTLALSGGGFTAVQVALRQPALGGAIEGVGRVAPLTAGGSRLALGPVRFRAAGGGVTSIDTVATIDGPFDGGSVTGLVLPIAARFDGRGGFALGETCLPARVRSFTTGTLRLGAAAFSLCPTGRALVWKTPGGVVAGGASVRAPRFAGTLGSSPVSIAASRLLFGLEGPGFTASDLAVRLGPADAANRLDIASFTGRFGGPGVSGRYSGLSARLAAVPLLLSDGAGRWSLAGSDLAMQGALRVADTMDPARFHPLVAPDFRLTLSNNAIAAGGWLDDPETGTRVMQADIAHSLNSGAGRAKLAVPGIRFDENFQPEALTRLTTGVIALVRGVLRGDAEIRWDSQGTTSTATFATDDMDFAAAFGPVEGFKSTVHFTDLLGLASAPGQLAEVDLIRTGIDVFDGRIRYQLLPGLRVRVEGGRWPFAGGELSLEETILDFSQPSTKQLTFRVTGLDAARFIQQMEFSNISATGTFDGIIPMVFDQQGGRIVGGHLIAREGGGTLSYVGELTDKDLGTYGKLAFDALKSMRYSKLTIALDGALDGEFVAGIELDGVARDPVLTVAPAGGGISGLVARRALGQLAKIPFEFNITVRGPFRALLATARSFEDPSNLIQSVLPEKLREQSAFPSPLDDSPAPPAPARPPAQPPVQFTPVQPKESETVR